MAEIEDNYETKLDTIRGILAYMAILLTAITVMMLYVFFKFF